MSDAPILSVEGLEVAFPGRRKGQVIKAVDKVDFVVRQSETFGIIGESGSGKTTVGRALVCLIEPTGGSIRHYGDDPFALSARALRRHRRG